MNPRIPALLALLLALALGVPAHAAVDPVRLRVAPQDIKAPDVQWYGVYTSGKKAGYARISVDRSSDPSVPGWEMVMDYTLQVVSMGSRVEAKVKDTYLFEEQWPYALARADHQGADGKTIELARADRGYTAVVREKGNSREFRIENLEWTLADMYTHVLWFRQGRTPGDTLSVRAFQLENLRSGVDTYVVRDVRRATSSGVPATFYQCELRSTLADLSGAGVFDDRGTMHSATLGGLMEMRREPEEAARKKDMSFDLYALGLSLVDKPLGDQRTLARLDMEVFGWGGKFLRDGPRQSVAYDSRSGSWRISLGAGRGRPAKAEPGEVKRALAETVAYPVKDMQVQALAREAVGDAKDDWAKARRLVAFVKDFIADEVRVEPTGVYDILEERRGDCTEHALLFTTLARAAGVPARTVWGLLYTGDAGQSFGGHAWNEVAVDGQWREVDAVLGETEPNPTHIRMGQDEGGQAGMLNGEYIFFRVLSEERLPPDLDALEKTVRGLLQQDDAAVRPRVDEIKTLAGLLADRGRAGEATEYWEAALRVEPRGLDARLGLARALLASGNKARAAREAAILLQYAEDQGLYDRAAEIMRSSGGTLPKAPAPAKAEERIRVALAPLGRPNPLVLDELRELLQYKLGVAVDVLDKPMALGQPDRTMAEQYVDGVFGNLAQRMDPKALAGILADLGHKGAGAPTYEIKKQAVTAVLRQLGSATKRERFQFFLTARKMEEQGQYSVTPIVTNMRKLYDPGKGTPHRLFMAVTDSDIYGPRTNFLYGAAVQGASVISYHRFAAAFTGEEQDRPRLVTRLVKQALSSVLYMLEIPRCDSPDCARAYSHDLHEHDRKPDQLCAKCLQALKDKLEQLLDRDRGARPKPKGPSV